ncbi:MAG: MFS transporter [Patescibacteria group bacterium]|jgi:MFS family permease
MQKISRNVLLLGLVSLLTDIGSEMVYPLIPVILSTMASAPFALGLIEGVAESTASLAKFYFGYLSDKIKKRKRFAVFGYGLSLVGQAVLALAGNWPLVLASRFINRFGKGIRTAPRDALINESVPKERLGAAFGLHRAMDTAGALIGVLIAYFLIAKFSFSASRAIYFSLIPLLLGIGALSLVKEKPKEEDDKKILPRLAISIFSNRLKFFYLVSFIFALGNSSNLFLILRSLNLGFKPASAILLYGLYNLFHALSSYPSGRLADRLGFERVLMLGYFLYGLVYLSFSFVDGKIFTILLFAVYGLYAGLTEGVEKAFVANEAGPERKATAQGVHATIVGSMLFPASILAGAVWQFFGFTFTFLFSASLAFLCAILMIRLMKMKART